MNTRRLCNVGVINSKIKSEGNFVGVILLCGGEIIDLDNLEMLPYFIELNDVIAPYTRRNALIFSVS